ncbi:exodeoxyribonuclease VII large subunit [Clavibacter michiganensis]|uniref:exodeoxyribonuclease VII large subunit n=1 Tax=Clavibacter michiganensis TaxID=28447 RepID=UPI0015597CF2|nr:exodeoxyribonuclease VII large subunit [Clavibacter michiganensis]
MRETGGCGSPGARLPDMAAFPPQTPGRGAAEVVTFSQLSSSFLLSERETVKISGEIAEISKTRTRFELVDMTGVLDGRTRSIPTICNPETITGLRVGDVVELTGRFDVLDQDCLLALRATRASKKESRGRLSPREQRARLANDPRTCAVARHRLERRTTPPSGLPRSVSPSGSLRVTFIGPLSDTARSDIKSGLRLDKMEPRWFGIPFNDSQAIADRVTSVSKEDTDLIVLFRGGGKWRDWVVLNDVRVINAVAEADVPVVTAVGHTTTDAAVAWVADGDFRTPTEVRTALHKLLYVNTPSPLDVPAPRRSAPISAPPPATTSPCGAERLAAEHARSAPTQHDLVTARAEVAEARRLVVEAERSFALHRIQVRAVVLGLSAGIGTVVATLNLSSWMSTDPWYAIVGSALGLLTAGTAGAVFLFRGRSRALLPPRRIREGMPEVGQDAWLFALRHAQSPRQYRRLHGSSQER